MGERTTIEVDLPDELVFACMKLAHEQDITFNQFVENLLREYIERHTNG